jgi:hypothetical protein
MVPMKQCQDQIHGRGKVPNLGMTLERSARLLINIDHFPIRVAREINADIDFYICHFLVDLYLSLSLSARCFYLLSWVYLLL